MLEETKGPSADSEAQQAVQVTVPVYKQLGLLDRLLTPLILLAMILGVVVGKYAPNVQKIFDSVRFGAVSVPIAIGLILMVHIYILFPFLTEKILQMCPILTKVQYETISKIFSGRRIWIHIGLSLVLNWIVGPFIMFGLACATLPDQPDFRVGVILVGIARCIAMVLMWNQLAGGDVNYCAILVAINSVLQIVLYSPFSLLLVNVLAGSNGQISRQLSYGSVAVSVLIFLGVPFLVGVTTRYSVWYTSSKAFLENSFLPFIGPLSLLGLLYTVIVIFAYQGQRIIDDIGSVFRVFVPMILYFIIMWITTFAFLYFLSRRDRAGIFGYEVAVVQAFTAGSNNFELAIAVAIKEYGAGSDQALAATIGPLVEVPVLLGLTFVALFFKTRLRWYKEGM